MAIRSDVTVDYSVSPRVITVAAPSVEITIQDLHDTLQEIQDDQHNLTFNNLLTSTGKDDLGGSTFTGITLKLLNAQLAFAARPGPTTVQCKVSGGNLVAVDGLGATINPIKPTDFTQVTLFQSTAPTLVESGVSGLTAEESNKLKKSLTLDDFIALK